MEINPTELGIVFGAVMAAIKILELIINKFFGLEKAVSNHLTHKLEEMKECEAVNASKIVDAIIEMRLELSNKLTEINTRLQK